MPVLVTLPILKSPDRMPLSGGTAHCKSRRMIVSACSTGTAASTAFAVASRKCSAVKKTALIAIRTIAATPIARITSISVNAPVLLICIFTAISSSRWASADWPVCSASPNNLCPARNMSLPPPADCIAFLRPCLAFQRPAVILRAFAHRAALRAAVPVCHHDAFVQNPCPPRAPPRFCGRRPRQPVAMCSASTAVGTTMP